MREIVGLESGVEVSTLGSFWRISNIKKCVVNCGGFLGFEFVS